MHNLTDTEIKALRPTAIITRHFDGGGLYIEVLPSGGKSWRLKYRIAGGARQVEKRLSLGRYPVTSLKEARERAQEARRLLANGVDPSVAKRAAAQAKADSSSNCFEALAREWLAIRLTPAVSEGQVRRVQRRLERDVFPRLGMLPVADLDGPTILRVIRLVESRGAIETARRELQTIGQVMRYAVATGRAARDPAADLRGALQPIISQHMASITQPDRFAGLLRAVDGYQGMFHVRCALQLLALTFVRPGELRAACWAEINVDEAMWRIPAERMKGDKARKASGQPHLVPLSSQAVAVLRELRLVTGHRPHLFPSTRGDGRVMSDMTLTAALRRLGFSGDEMSAHGFRAAARTMMVERLDIDESVVEAQLAHRVRDALGRAYNRTQFVAQRVAAMQRWGDYLDQLRADQRPPQNAHRRVEELC